MVKLKADERIDQLYSQSVSIIQSPNVFSFSLDAVLLANFTVITKKDKNIVDLCAGNGAVGLFLSTQINPDAHIYSIELQSELADMATRSLELNHLEKQITIINTDLKDSFNYLKKDSMDVVTCNPPYFVNYDSSQKNPNRHLALARHELTTNLAEVAEISAGLLKMNGNFFCVFRPDRLTDLLETLRKYRLEPKIVQYVRPHENKDANMVLVKAIKDGKRNGVKVIPDIIVYDGDQYSQQVKEILYGK